MSSLVVLVNTLQDYNESRNKNKLMSASTQLRISIITIKSIRWRFLRSEQLNMV